MDLSAMLGLFGDNEVEKVGSQTGLDKNQTMIALSAALPTILFRKKIVVILIFN